MKSTWKIENLGKYITQQSIRNSGIENIEVYSVTNSEGFTKSTDYFSKEVFSKDLSNYKLVKRNQFAYNPSRINVGSIACLTATDYALVSPLYIIFEVDKGILYSEYLLRYLKSHYSIVQIKNNTQGSVRDSLKYNGLEKIQIPLPPLDDQSRIAAVLARAEKLIAKRKESVKALFCNNYAATFFASSIISSISAGVNNPRMPSGCSIVKGDCIKSLLCTVSLSRIKSFRRFKKSSCRELRYV